jgi:hypothetical protein
MNARPGDWRAGLPRFNQRRLPFTWSFPMTLHLSMAPLIALIAGILILIVPRMLNYIVAIYLIVIGVLGLLGYNMRV